MKGLFFEGPIFRGAYVRREIFVSKSIGQLVVETKFTIFTCFTLYSRANSKYKPPGRLIFGGGGGDLTEGFLRYDSGGLILGGAYTWRGLFSEFYCIFEK